VPEGERPLIPIRLLSVAFRKWRFLGGQAWQAEGSPLAGAHLARPLREKIVGAEFEQARIETYLIAAALQHG